MNSSFLNTIFSKEGFVQDYREFLGIDSTLFFLLYLFFFVGLKIFVKN